MASGSSCRFLAPSPNGRPTGSSPKASIKHGHGFHTAAVLILVHGSRLAHPPAFRVVTNLGNSSKSFDHVQRRNDARRNSANWPKRRCRMWPCLPHVHSGDHLSGGPAVQPKREGAFSLLAVDLPGGCLVCDMDCPDVRRGHSIPQSTRCDSVPTAGPRLPHSLARGDGQRIQRQTHQSADHWPARREASRSLSQPLFTACGAAGRGPQRRLLFLLIFFGGLNFGREASLRELFFGLFELPGTAFLPVRGMPSSTIENCSLRSAARMRSRITCTRSPERKRRPVRSPMISCVFSRQV